MAYFRLACVALALLSPFAALRVASVRAHDEPRAFESQMPVTFGEWKSVRETELEPEALELLAPVTYSMRLYAAEGRPSIWVYVAFYSGAETSGAHDPQICYPAQGWTIAEQDEVRVDVSPAESFPARFMRTELGGAQEFDLYWFQPVDRWPAPILREYFRRVLDKVQGRQEYAFVRISLRGSAPEPGISAAESEALASIAAAIAPWARQAVHSLAAAGARDPVRALDRATFDSERASRAPGPGK